MTEHLTFEELVEFNSLGLCELKESELSARVTAHIRACRECREALAVIQNATEAMVKHVRGREKGIGAEKHGMSKG